MTITLRDGREVESNDLSFNRNIYHFTRRSTGEDVTNLINRADKLRIVPDFDIDSDLLRSSRERPFSGGGRVVTGPQDIEPLEESTAKIFAEQILNDPLDAPLDTLDAGVKKVFESTGVRTILIFAALGIGAAIYFKSK
jgi:hypothetical protein